MAIQIREVKSRHDLKTFVYLPEKIHKDHKNWVPPFYSDEWKYFNPKYNRAFDYCEIILLNAYMDGKIVGRIMGINNKRHNIAKNENSARFALFESIDSQDVAHELLSYVEKWAIGLGLNKIIGPFGMTYHDPMGFMTEGFDKTPAVSTYSNFEYIIQLLEVEGYDTEENLFVYRLDMKNEIPAIHRRIYPKVLSNPHVSKLHFKTKSDIKPYIVPILKLMNDCFNEILGYSILDEKEMKILAAHYLPVLIPKYVQVIKYDDELAGFMIAMPNIARGIIASRGRLFPFGFVKILLAQKDRHQLDLLIGGILEKYRGLGIDVILGVDIIEMAKKTGFDIIDSHLELESNYKVRAEMEKLGGEVYKRYRIFRKNLS